MASLRLFFPLLVFLGVFACLSTHVEAEEQPLEEKVRQLTAALFEVKELVHKLKARVEKLENAAGGGGADEADETDVLVLDATNFDSTVKEHSATLVEFYAPWCGHCKALKPEYAKAATALKGKAPLAKVDCTAEANKDLCSKHDVSGFPTIKLFRNDGTAPTDYSGERKAEDLINFMQRQSGPAVTALDSKDAVNDFAKDEYVRLVAFTEGSYDGYKHAANSLRNQFFFGLVTDPKVAAEFNVKMPSILMFRQFDDSPAVFSGDFASKDAEADVAKFIRTEQLPVMGSLTVSNYQQYYDRGFPFVWMFLKLDDKAQMDLIDKEVLPVANAFRSSVSFVKMDGERWGEHAKNLGLSGSMPSFVIEDRKDNKHYVFDESAEITEKTFTKFINDYLNGALKAHMKSEEPPAKNDGPVTVVVGKTFDDIVNDDSKDVLVEFYAPWCGHCKALEPKYTELGKKYSADNSVVIAKIDYTANDGSADVKGFPTILFYPAGQKDKPIEFTGDRETAALAEFIEENRKTSTGNKKEL